MSYNDWMDMEKKVSRSDMYKFGFICSIPFLGFIVLLSLYIYNVLTKPDIRK